MTYCAGWIYKNSVYLLADTAATKALAPYHPRSSFGERHAKVGADHVEESLLKLVPIADGAAIAFAGDVQIASAICDFLRDAYDESAPAEAIFEQMSATVGPFDLQRPVELLLAMSTGDNVSLDRWDTINGLDRSNSSFYQLGSLTSFHASLTPSILSVLTRGNVEADRLLALAAAVVQSYGVNDNLIDQNIGGLIFGLRISGGHVTWQEDTSYLVYGSSMAEVNYVSAFARDDVLIVSSSLNDDVRILAHSTSTPSLTDWRAVWEQPLKAQLRSDRYRYWVFLKTVERVITVVRRESLDQPSKLLSLSESAFGQFNIGLSPKLMHVMHAPVIDNGDGSLPFRLNFLNG